MILGIILKQIIIPDPGKRNVKSLIVFVQDRIQPLAALAPSEYLMNCL